MRIQFISACALLTMTAVLSAMQASADVKTRADAAVLNSVASTEAPSARDTSNLRCWQYGELLFEETHLGDSKVGGSSVMVFEGDSSAGKAADRELYLINTGSATCLYEKI